MAPRPFKVEDEILGAAYGVRESASIYRCLACDELGGELFAFAEWLEDEEEASVIVWFQTAESCSFDE